MESERPMTAKPMTDTPTMDTPTMDTPTMDTLTIDTSTTAALLEVDPHRVAGCLRELLAQLDSANEMVLDFSSVRRIDAQAVHALEELAALAEAKGAKIALRDVNVDVYKVLKLVKLTSRFSLLT